MHFICRLNSSPPVAVVALCLVIAWLLAGCVTKPSAPQISSLSPSVLQQGKPGRVTAQVERWTADTHLALMPAGPYVTHQLSLSSPPTAMVMDGERVFVATTDMRLLVVEFPQKMPAARVVAQRHLEGPVQHLAYADRRLFMVFSDGQLKWLDVSPSGTLSELAVSASSGEVLDVQFDAEASYLLLGGGAGETRLQRWSFAADKTVHIDREWSLPIEAVAFAVRGQYLWSVGSDGIALLDISGEQVVLMDVQPISGMSTDVQLQGQLALVADGRGGLVLYDISQPSQLQWRGSFSKRGAIRGFSVSEGSADQSGALVALRNGGVLRLGLHNPELPSSGAAFFSKSPVLASTLQDDVAMLATRHSLQRVMMVGGGDGAISTEGLNLGGSRRGTIRDDILYVADWFSGLHLYDISNPRQLRHLSNYHTPGSSKGVALLGNYALVGDDDQGLQIIDIEDPRRPSWTAELPPEAMAKLGLAYTMKLVGKILYLADHRGGFHIIDLSDIYHPRRVGGYDTPSKAWDIDVKDNVAFVADDSAGLLMFDVSDPAQPKPFAQFNPGGQAEAVALQDGRAYVAFFDKGLYTLDVSNPRKANVIGHTPIPGNARGIELGDGLIYVASWEAGLQIVDTRGPAVPRIIGSFDSDGAAWGVNVKDGYAYVLDWWGGIKVVDVRQPSRPTYVGRYHARGTLQQLRSKDTYMYAASGAGGLQVYDIKNPLNPIWLKGLDMDGQAQDVWIEDDRAYVAAGDGGVAIFDILDPFYTRQVGGIDTPGDASKAVAGNDYVYIADDQAGLVVMDVRDPQRPVEVARYGVNIGDMWLDEQDLWLVTGTGVEQWSLNDDGSAVRAAAVPGVFTWVRAQDGLLATGTYSGTVKLWEHASQGVRMLSQYEVGDAIVGMQLGEGRLYLVGEHTGVHVLDITEPQSPSLVIAYPATGHHTQIAIARGAAFLAGESKLASVTLLPALSVNQQANTALTVNIPAGLPRGDYHLLAVEPGGQRHLMPNALTLQFSAPGKKNTTLDAFRRLMKTPLKPPVESSTELPSPAGPQ